MPVAGERRWLGIFLVPAISAGALGRFRALLGFAFLAILIFADPIRAVPLEMQHAYSPLADVDWVHALAASETGTRLLQLLGCASALLFALGVFARPSYVVLVAVLLLHATMLLVRRGVHDWDLPIITLLALLVVPWGDAPPLIRTRRGGSRLKAPRGDVRRRAYGFAIWLPGLTIGLAFAAAAYAKLNTSGLEWITSGAIRYHFVDDGQNAPVPWGLWIATQPSVAIVLSFAAIAVEALLIANVFVRGWTTRAAFGMAGAALMAGFFLFQGVRWFPWWVLFAAFLPWHRIPPANSRPESERISAGRDLTWVHVAVVAVLAGAQAWASYRAIEIEPLLSNYPMYSITYASPEHFERSHARLRFEAGGSDITDQVDAAEGRSTLEAVVEQSEESDGSAADVALALEAFEERYARLHGAPPATIDVVLVKEPFDWKAGRYLPHVRERLGSVQLRRPDDFVRRR